MTLLGACHLRKDALRAERIGARLLEQYPQDAEIYVALGNTLAAAGQWEEAMKVRQLMDERGVKKIPGISWIEIDGRVHNFYMNAREHPDAQIVQSGRRLSNG